MMNHYYTLLALDLARERADEAARYRRFTSLDAGHAGRPSTVRRGLAHGLATVSRASAAVARRLDDRTADDLIRSLAPSK